MRKQYVSYNVLLYCYSYDEDLKILGQIPILPALLAAEGMTECDFETSCVTKSPEQKETSTAEVGSRTLLDWIASSDKSSMEQIYKNCTEGLTKVRMTLFFLLVCVVYKMMIVFF